MSWAVTAYFGMPVTSDCKAFLDERQAEIDRQSTMAKVWLSDAATQAQVEAIRARAATLDGVISITLTTKAEALERAKQLFEDSPEVLRDLSGNPFPASVDIQFEARADLDRVQALIGGMPGVDQVGVGGKKAERAIEFMREGGAGPHCHEFMDEMNKDEE